MLSGFFPLPSVRSRPVWTAFARAIRKQPRAWARTDYAYCGASMCRYSCRGFSPHFCWRSEEHTSELQSRGLLVCRLLLEKKKTKIRDRSCVIGLDERSPTGTADRGDPYEKDMRGDRNAPYRGRAGLMQQPEDGTVAEDNP